jgi:hypothetical protein
MKRIFLLLAIALPTFAQGAPTILTLFSLLGKCPASTPAIPTWNGTQFICATLGPGLSLSTAGVLTVTAPPTTPVWQVETLSFANVATGSTTTTYTTLKTPVAGVLLYFYSSANLFTSSWGAVAYTGQPVTITLPTGWAATDSVTFVYASQ